MPFQIRRRIGRALAEYLSRPNPRGGLRRLAAADRLPKTLELGDVVLVDGDSRISTAIKYLTQSSWSHAALYVGEMDPPAGRGAAQSMLIEADVVEGIIAVPLSKYAGARTRVCRPVGLTAEDRRQVVAHVLARRGQGYDLRHVWDLARYLIATPPVPVRWRRRMIALGSGDPTRAICSTLIAQAFQAVRYPILPEVDEVQSDRCETCVDDIYRLRHHSLFTPRDFDLSPYFAVIKPALESGFDYQRLRWADAEAASTGAAGVPALRRE